MKLLKIVPILSASALLALQACGKKEDKATQIPPPPPAEAAQATGEPDLKPIQSVGGQGSGQFNLGGGAGAPTSDGNYVIQVDIKPSQKAADKVVEKLRSNGIEAYVAEVENPGELEGTYFRVRIGFFGNIAEATNYAKNTLAPLGYAWWVDNKKNDAVGNPGGGESSSDYTAPTPASDWSQPTPAAAATEPTPAAPAEPAPAPAAAPAPEPAPAAAPPAPAPAAADDEWQ